MTFERREEQESNTDVGALTGIVLWHLEPALSSEARYMVVLRARRTVETIVTLTNTARHRGVIVGSGFGGLFATKSLAHAPDMIDVTLISRTNHHLFQPLLYQVATGILSEG